MKMQKQQENGMGASRENRTWVEINIICGKGKKKKMKKRSRERWKQKEINRNCKTQNER
jgi:hypothetical protein